MIDTGTLNLAWCASLVSGLAAAGVQQAVISPGSRSTPITLALLRHPDIQCEVVLDERCAAFFALGLAKASGTPVALVGTSGTAIANWLPAVVEAGQRGIPLLLLSADRPPELQGCGANQTIDQGELFGRRVRACHAPGAPFAGFDPRWLHQLTARAVGDSQWPNAGPVHLNLPFREPLLPAEPTLNFEVPATAPVLPPQAMPSPEAIAAAAERLNGTHGIHGRRGLIVCGEGPYPDDFAPAVAALAAALDCPILAEPLSGLRFGPHDRSHICCHYGTWLRQPELRPATPDWVLRFGAFPLTRGLQNALADIGEQLLVDHSGRWPDPAQRTELLLRGDAVAVCRGLLAEPLRPAAPDWVQAFRQAEQRAAELASRERPPEGELFAALCARLPAGTQLFCGNSMPIRDLDTHSGSGDQPLRFHANRGASGIDGNIATAAGLAASGPTVAVIGDLTAQHDLGGLALMRDKPLVLIVINNGGGGIFDLLPQASLPEFEPAWLAPQQLDFAHAAAAFSLSYQHLTTPAAVVAATLTALSDKHPCLLELRIDRKQSLALRQR